MGTAAGEEKMNVLADFNTRFMNEPEAAAYLIALFHGAYRCPFCEMPIPKKQYSRFESGGRIRCKSCERMFVYRTGTPLSSSKITASQVLMIMTMTEAGCTDKQISDVVKVSAETVSYWRVKLEVINA
jgi:transposase-like protein